MKIYRAIRQKLFATVSKFYESSIPCGGAGVSFARGYHVPRSAADFLDADNVRAICSPARYFSLLQLSALNIREGTAKGRF